ncbi:RNA polymerase II transcription factor SIII subunit A-domain-containing protein [Cunninghamella echinulata]|nr:RNA polymerase II transcription factor SIII subunit A-domain-containing protein [Cunninghamella echinulata]
MLKQVKSLVQISQETLANNIDGLSYVGVVPYYLLKPSLKKASPQQLFLIERLNPHLLPESNELWLNHMLSYTDLRVAYNQGLHQSSSSWRELYLKRYQENEQRKRAISEKVKNQYNKIQNEKAARSIKVIKNVTSVRGRTNESRKTTGSSKLFIETRKAANKTNAIYRCHAHSAIHKHPYANASISNNNNNNNNSSIINISKPPSKLAQSYQSNRAKFGTPTILPSSVSQLIPPPSPIKSPSLSKSNSTSIYNCASTYEYTRNIKQQQHQQKDFLTESNISKPSPTSPVNKTRKPTAIVNFNIFDELA